MLLAGHFRPIDDVRGVSAVPRIGTEFGSGHDRTALP